MVRPCSIDLRTFMQRTFWITALPEVRAVIDRPSRIGTPEVISVPSVRVKRATAILQQQRSEDGQIQQDTVGDQAPSGILRTGLDDDNSRSGRR